jgi:SAM-dependent methyltransferase
MTISSSSYQLLDLLTQYQTPAIVMAAHKVGLFRALGAGPATLAELAERLTLPERALQLLVQEGERFANGTLAAETLVPGAPGYSGRLVDKEAFFYQAWGRLESCVRTDTAAIASLQARARSEPETTRNFLLALDDIAALYGGAFVPALDLAGTRRLLDVGGGVGSYALGLARAYPELQATILELPEVVPWTRDFVAAAGLGARIDVAVGDFLTAEFPRGYDTVLLANIFHDQPTAVNQGLLAKAYRALPAGGRVVVYEFLLAEDRVSPPTSALFAVMMLVENQGGNVYTGGELRSWLAGAGFANITVTPLPAPSPMGLVCGSKL